MYNKTVTDIITVRKRAVDTACIFQLYEKWMRVGKGAVMTSEFTIALHALVFLNHHGKVMTSDDIAVNVCTNPARVRKVLSKLKKADLLETREGSRGGGYRFHRNAETITLLMVYQALQERIIHSSWHSGSMDIGCLISSNMAAIMDDIMLELDEACKEKLSGITVKDIDEKIFRKGGIEE